MKLRYGNTKIAPERTKADIEKMLKENGIQDIQWTTFHGETSLEFIWNVTIKGVNRGIAFRFVPPNIPVQKRTWTGMRYEKVTVNLEATAFRLLWHYLYNKLEAVRMGLVSMEKEFLSQAVVSLPDGKTATIGERIDAVYEAASKPSLEDQRTDKSNSEWHKTDKSKIVEGEVVGENV